MIYYNNHFDTSCTVSEYVDNFKGYYKTVIVKYAFNSDVKKLISKVNSFFNTDNTTDTKWSLFTRGALLKCSPEIFKDEPSLLAIMMVQDYDHENSFVQIDESKKQIQCVFRFFNIGDRKSKGVRPAHIFMIPVTILERLLSLETQNIIFDM